MSSKIVEQVREGLTEKIDVISGALRVVRDPRELERLQKELNDAKAALEKLNAPDTRSAEEIEKVANMIKDDAGVDASVSWSKMDPIDKFKYQFDLYTDKLAESLEAAIKQHEEICKVYQILTSIDDDCLNTLCKQFEQTKIEIEYSINMLTVQQSLHDAALEAVNRSFGDLEIINHYLNNPMSLPHLTEQREATLASMGASTAMHLKRWDNAKKS